MRVFFKFNFGPTTFFSDWQIKKIISCVIQDFSVPVFNETFVLNFHPQCWDKNNNLPRIFFFRQIALVKCYELYSFAILVFVTSSWGIRSGVNLLKPCRICHTLSYP